MEPFDEADINEHIVGLIMAHQYTPKKGLELFGKKAEEAAVKELKQIHDMDTYTPIDPKTLSKVHFQKKLLLLQRRLQPNTGSRSQKEIFQRRFQKSKRGPFIMLSHSCCFYA